MHEHPTSRSSLAYKPLKSLANESCLLHTTRLNSSINDSQSHFQNDGHKGTKKRDLLHTPPLRYRRSKHLADRLSPPNMDEQDPLLLALEPLQSIPSSIRHISQSLNFKPEKDLPEKQ